MKLIFDFPAKMYVLENSKKHTSHRFSYEGLEFLFFPSTNVYVDSKKEKIKYEKSIISTFFMKIEDDMYVYTTQADDLQHFIRRFDMGNWGELLNQQIEKYKEIFQNVEQYNEEKQNELARKKQERLKELEELDRRALEKARKELEELEHALAQAKESFLNGGQISFFHFEMLCNRYDVKIPIRTLGAARKHIVTIGKDRSSVYKSLNSIFIYSNELYNRMAEQSIEIDEDLQKLFGKV